MKGTGTSYGFPEITELGAALENAARSSDTQGVLAAAELLEASLDAVDSGPHSPTESVQ